jgi:hypothetical protein
VTSLAQAVASAADAAEHNGEAAQGLRDLAASLEAASRAQAA